MYIQTIESTVTLVIQLQKYDPGQLLCISMRDKARPPGSKSHGLPAVRLLL